MTDVPPGHLYLGEQVDPTTHSRSGTTVMLEASDLTTHGVIVGMTGSGKTGLAVVLIEEALLQGIPVIAIDPKGDLGNLALRFPDLAPSSFRPWVNEADASREGRTPDEHAAAVAASWSEGLASWGVTAQRLTELSTTSQVTIYTPGSTAGVPIDLVGRLDAPAGAADAEVTQDEIEGFASSLLGLVGIEADPLSSREHILISNLIHHAWSQGQSLDLAALVGQVQSPPIRKLGVLDLESFFPKDDRTQLALKLNGLLASPSFAAWAQGDPLDIDAWMDTRAGAKASVVSLSHLSDEERQFVATLILSKIVTWFRRQPGTPELRALIYMDEVFGFVPPTAAPPTKKPILTIMKQARAFGVGMVLATQNPVDVDYKAISNAGTWLVGRLQTERDKARLLEGMSSASGAVDLPQLDATIGGLAKREFVLHQAKRTTPVIFGSRWAMSYLAGPLTRDQIARLTPDPATPTSPAASPVPSPPPTATPTDPSAIAVPAAPAPAAAAPASPLAADETPLAPPVADGVPVRYADPSAPWLAAAGGSPTGRRYRAALVARIAVTFDETDLRHTDEYELVLHPLTNPVDPAAALAVDYDDRDLIDAPPAGAVYVLPTAPLDTKGYLTGAQKAIADHVTRTRTLALFSNRDLKLVSRPDETRQQFEDRCGTAADDGADADAAKIRAVVEKKLDRVQDAMNKAEDRLREVKSDAEGRQQSEVLSRAGDLLGGLLGGRGGTRSILGKLRRAAGDRRQSSNASERVASAEHRVAEKVDELEALQTELEDTLFDIQADWDGKATNIEDLTIALERTDVDIADFGVVWIPTS